MRMKNNISSKAVLTKLVPILGIVFVLIWLYLEALPNFSFFSLTATPSITPTITSTPTSTDPIAYIIKEGDTLQGVAEQFNLGPDGVLLLLDNNPEIMQNGGVYFVGQTIRVPPAGTIRNTPTPIPASLPRGTRIEYQVLPGDTLAGIAAAFNSREADIMALNNIESPNALLAGQILQIPVNHVTVTVTPSPKPIPASHPTFFLQGFDLISSLTCTVQQAHVHATPLLEEKWDLGSRALIPNLCDPLHD